MYIENYSKIFIKKFKFLYLEYKCFFEILEKFQIKLKKPNTFSLHYTQSSFRR